MDKGVKRILDEALYSTYSVFCERRDPENARHQIISATTAYIQEGISTYFTRTDGARDNIEKYIDRTELAMLLAENLVNVSNTQVSRTDEQQEIFYQIALRELILGDRKQVAKELADIMLGKGSTEFGIDSLSFTEIAAELYAPSAVAKLEMDTERLQEEVQSVMEPKYEVRRLWINRSAVNYCRDEVRDGTQIQIQNDIKARNPDKLPRREYNLNDELMATTDIGVRRSTQQDSVLILYYPDNPNYKMLVVADGVGGSKDGHLASSEIVRQMKEWFESLTPDVFKAGNEQMLCTSWNNALMDINQDILEKFPGSGSTFVGGIVGEDTTMIASVGDSRAYAIMCDNELYQLTSDDSEGFKIWEKSWKEYEEAIKRPLTSEELTSKADQKDDLRYYQDSNIITQCFGAKKLKYPSVKYTYLPNSAYRTLMLFSDGVTDCLSDNQIMAITKRTKSKDLAAAIVNEALVHDSKKDKLVSVEGFYSEISGGKDNTTAAVYDNTKYKGEER